MKPESEMNRWERLALRFVKLTKPLVWKIASAYDLRIDRPHYASGQNPLMIEDSPEEAQHHIPNSVVFNTRSGSIFVGRNTLFGGDVMVLTGKHMGVAEAARRGVAHHHVPASGRDIRIGRGCFIGGGAIILGPVVIGDYAIIGAGAVVTHDVPAHGFAVGNPARVVRLLDAPVAIEPTIGEGV